MSDSTEQEATAKKIEEVFTIDEEIKVDTNKAYIGGTLAAATSLLGASIVGTASGVETFTLLQTSLETTRSFAATITLALGTILALMLTLLSLSAATNIELKWGHYIRVKQISLVTTVTLIASILVYLLLNIPLSEAEGKTVPWFGYLYYTTLAVSSILGGAAITIVMMLYDTAKDIILVLAPKEDVGKSLVREEEEEEKEREEEREKEKEEEKEH